MTTTQIDIVAEARHHAACAWDQRNIRGYDSPEEAIESYRQNMYDTFREMGLRLEWFEDQMTGSAFDAEIARLAGGAK
jgi:hypothetical protein